MAKKITTNVTISGPLFDIPDIQAEVEKVVREGIGELTDAGRDIAQSFAAPRSRTGRFERGIQAFMGKGMVGFVRQSDTFGKGTARPISTWLERGTRGGVKLRPGKGIFGPAYNRVNAIDKDTYFIGKLTERFGG